MFKMPVNQNHISLTSCETVSEIMLPILKGHGITVFNYYRVYLNGEMLRFSTDRSWTEHYFKKNYLKNVRPPEAYLSKDVNYFVWLIEDCPEMLLDAAINFNTSNGISIAQKGDNYVDFFCFATTRNNRKIINTFYLNNLDVLLNYCDYFKEHAKQLIHLGEKQKIILPEFEYSAKKIEFTNRQLDCAFLLLKGLQYKEIAKKLLLSSRTVETHINGLKNKLNCKNKAELIISLSEIIR
ncbi:MAG: LuxR family transcriptional regulator [Legionella longbeachae]|nr:LuxR family transcriptional regulator [Legionella longbeachae]